MEPVPERLATSESLDFQLVEPTTILFEPPERPIHVVCDHKASVSELVQWTTEAKAGPPEDVRGVLISEVNVPEDKEQLDDMLARRRAVGVYKCVGHVVYPPELYSYIYYELVIVIVFAARIRKEAVKLR